MKVSSELDQALVARGFVSRERAQPLMAGMSCERSESHRRERSFSDDKLELRRRPSLCVGALNLKGSRISLSLAGLGVRGRRRLNRWITDGYFVEGPLSFLLTLGTEQMAWSNRQVTSDRLGTRNIRH